jgi:small-conductance mechanosensitive channel
MMNEGINFLNFVRVGGILPAILILAGAWIAAWTVGRFLARLGARFTDRRLLIQQVSTIMQLLLYLTGVLIASMLAFRFSREMLLAIGGTFAVAVGFAFKDIAASVISGIFIIIDRPFQVGDRVTFGGYYGEVKKIGLRAVRLVTLDDNLVSIPNNKFLTDAVASANAGELDMLVQLDFYIGCEQDIDTAKEVVRDAITSSRYTYLGKPWSLLVNQVIYENHFAVRLRGKVYVLDVTYEKALETDVTERVMRGFRERGIAAPAILHRSLPGRVDSAPAPA